MRARSIALRLLLAIGTAAPFVAAGGCGGGTNSCKPKTLFVTVTFEGATKDADHVIVDVSIDGNPANRSTRPRVGTASTGTIEIDFPTVYPAGSRVDVTITAVTSGTDVGTGTGSIVSLPDGCAALPITIGEGSPAGSGGMGGMGGGTGGSTAGRGGTGGGSAGRGGSGGSVAGRGGTGGTGGAAGRGGTGGPANCVMGLSNRPPTALLTDFSDATANPASAGDIRFGSLSSLPGGSVRFASTNKGTLTIGGGALTFGATVEAPTPANMYPFSGFALYVDPPACLDASAYQGVSFTLSNVTGNCPILAKFADSEHTASGDDMPRGACSGSCYGGAYSVTAGTTQLPFSAIPTLAGMPATAFDPAKFISIQFQFQPASSGTTSCTGSFTVDNISFYGSAGGGAGTGGSGGRGGAGGGGGTGGAPACNPMVPTQALITNFSDTTAAPAPTLFSYGTGPASGGAFTYGTPAPVVTVTGGTLHAMLTAPAASAANYVGFGLSFNTCVNASAYAGVRFLLTGTVTGCTMQYTSNYSEGAATGSDPKGSCMQATCFSSQATITPQSTPRLVAWSDATGGVPVATVDQGKLVGVAWQFAVPANTACSADITIDDVAFSSFGQPACPSSVANHGPCAASDPQLCYKTCGPENIGARSETCTTAGSYAEMSGCAFDSIVGSYACYKLPSAANACPAGTPQQGTACSVNPCVVCNSTGGLAGGGFLDSTAAAKTGYCVCPAANGSGARTWSCATDVSWPCPGNTGC